MNRIAGHEEHKDRALPAEKKHLQGYSWLPVLLIWLAIWQVAYLWVGQDLLLASPRQVLMSLVRQVAQTAFWKTSLYSLLRIQAGFLLGLFCGSLLAVLTVRFIWLKKFFHPVISAIRSTPVASFIILALVWMSHQSVVVFIVFLMVLPIVWGNVAEGIEKTSRQLLEMGQVFRLSKLDTVRYIYIPSIAPFFTAAATTSLGLGWKAGIAAEVLSRPPLSLGGRLYDAKIYLETADLLAYTGVVIVISLTLERLLVLIFRSAGRYFQLHGLTGRKAETDS
ncbi:MAG: ABC transporter permease subunit [Ruminococcaceae bacterium]|jgi:NitT/TauT family transport system permease protein|nr:ABC transporter permease subunit [Oscillospiraceae bacterium]